MERSDIRDLCSIEHRPGFRRRSTRATCCGKRLLEEMTLSRTVVAVACFVLGGALVIPAGLRLWKFAVARLAPPEIPFLPEPLHNFVLYLNGQEIGEVTVLTTASVAGAALLLAGVMMVR